MALKKIVQRSNLREVETEGLKSCLVFCGTVEREIKV